jgi:aspartate carbamoyltransferase catalytic subunit
MIVMHPLPRNDEIDTAVDKDPRAVYFRYACFMLTSCLFELLNTSAIFCV